MPVNPEDYPRVAQPRGKRRFYEQIELPKKSATDEFKDWLAVPNRSDHQ